MVALGGGGCALATLLFALVFGVCCAGCKLGSGTGRCCTLFDELVMSAQERHRSHRDPVSDSSPPFPCYVSPASAWPGSDHSVAELCHVARYAARDSCCSLYSGT